MYGRVFSSVYDSRWPAFTKRVGPLVLDYYERHPGPQSGKRILDLCCGTGHFSMQALDKGYTVLGIDASSDMLMHARRNAQSYMDLGKAVFVQGRAESFEVDQPCGLAVSLFDSLNHLPDLDALRQCFVHTYRATLSGGLFIFDLNTRVNLRRWNAISITDEDEVLIVNRGIYSEGAPRAQVKITGFLRTESGLYERFEEDMFNTVFDLASVEDALRSAGWADVHLARVDALDTPLEEPEKENRVFFVATR